MFDIYIIIYLFIKYFHELSTNLNFIFNLLYFFLNKKKRKEKKNALIFTRGSLGTTRQIPDSRFRASPPLPSFVAAGAAFPFAGFIQVAPITVL